MAKEKNNCMVYGVDCKRLGSLYASALIANAKNTLEALPALAAHPRYNDLKELEREAVRRNILTEARELLIVSGLNPETVDAVMNRNDSKPEGAWKNNTEK